MTNYLNEDDIAFVSDLSIKAGIRAAEMREGVEIQQKTDIYDKVTAADFELSRLIVAALRIDFPAI